jgi:hypothetical protein
MAKDGKLDTTAKREKVQKRENELLHDLTEFLLVKTILVVI